MNLCARIKDAKEQEVSTPISTPDLSTRPFSLTVDRAMETPADVLFRAWSEQFDRWFAKPGVLLMKPDVNSVFFFEVEHEGQRHPHYGRFLRLEQDRLVEMTWLTGAAGTNCAETVVTVELTSSDKGTNLRLTHAGFYDAAARDQHEHAWNQILAQLDQKLLATSRI
jgi:uncharacterized protein YndB with AHSA1/START domain